MIRTLWKFHQVRNNLTPNNKAFPNVTFRPYGPIPMIADRDYVVTRWIGGGRHTGVAFDDLPAGRLAEPNTGKVIHFSGTTIFTLKDGKITEELGEEGALTALQQLGIVDPPNPSSGVYKASTMAAGKDTSAEKE